MYALPGFYFFLISHYFSFFREYEVNILQILVKCNYFIYLSFLRATLFVPRIFADFQRFKNLFLDIYEDEEEEIYQNFHRVASLSDSDKYGVELFAKEMYFLI